MRRKYCCLDQHVQDTQTVSDNSYRILEIAPDNDPRWNELVSRSPWGMVYHHPAWGEVLSKTYGCKPLYLGLMGEKDEQFEGGMVFFRISSWITGKRLLSLPFTTYCEPLVSEEHLDAMIKFALSRSPGTHTVKLKLLARDKGPFNHLGVPTRYVTHFLSLDGTLEELFRTFHSTSIRQRVRRAEKTGLKFRLTESESDLQIFCRLLTLVRQKYGLPSLPDAFYKNMWDILKPQGLMEVPIIEWEGKTIAAAILLKHHNIFHLEYSASDYHYLKYSPNQLLIWECIKLAHEAQARYFDFGRTDLGHQTLLEFKDRWQAKRLPLRLFSYPIEEKSYPERDKRFGIVRHLNRVLPPVLLEWEGRLLYRHLG